MIAFDYHRPRDLAQAAALLAQPETRALSGGMTLLPTIKNRLAAPAALVDLSGLPGLTEISEGAGTITLGALARHADVARSPLVRQRIPALAALAGSIGDPAVRHRGTLGGSLANNDPSADYPAAVLGLGAVVVTDRREIAADDFFKGLFETTLSEGEIVTSVRFPVARRAGYAKLKSPASRYPIIGVFVAETQAGVRVALTGGGRGVIRIGEFESALTADFKPEAVASLRLSPAGFSSDLHAEAAYRAHLASVLAARAVAQALG